jgi:hypothetical protein
MSVADILPESFPLFFQFFRGRQIAASLVARGTIALRTGPRSRS